MFTLNDSDRSLSFGTVILKSPRDSLVTLFFKGHKKYLPWILSSLLIWTVPRVTILAVLDVAEIISDGVFCWRDGASEAVLHLFTVWVWPVPFPQRMTHNSHSHLVCDSWTHLMGANREHEPQSLTSPCVSPGLDAFKFSSCAFPLYSHIH